MIKINHFLQNLPIYKKYRLYKIKSLIRNNDLSNIVRVEIPKNYDENITIQNNRFEKYLSNFNSVIKANFNKELLANYYNNLKTLKIHFYYVPPIFLSGAEGTYSPYTNKIIIYNKVNETIYHELFHLAAAIRRKKNFYTGFFYQDYNIEIGAGLNEGYTQLLTNRYFNVTGPFYEFEMAVAKHLEMIIGKDKMEKLYFNADLYGLIEKLLKYSDNRKIANFLSRLDYYTLRSYKNIGKREDKFLSNQIDKIVDFLIETYANKINSENSYSEEQKFELIEKFANDLYSEVYQYDDVNSSEKSK